METKAHEPVMPGLKSTAPPSRPALTTFLDHLVKNGVVTQSVALQASTWKRTHEKDRRTLAEILEKEFGVPSDVLRHQVALYYAFRVVDLSEPVARRMLLSDVSKIMRSLPEHVFQLAMKMKVLPYDLAENQSDKLVIVTPNPSEREIQEVARAFPFQKFEVCYMKESDWAQFWRQVTAERDKAPATPVEETVAPAKDESESGLETIIDREIARTQLPALIENVLADAVRSGATDIHFLPRGSRKTEVLIRIHGQLFVWYSFDDMRSEAVIAALKTRVFNLDRYERFAVQEGVAQRTIERHAVWFKASIIPIITREPSLRCESVVLSVLRAAEALPSLAQLDIDPRTRGVIANALAPMRGLVVFAGGRRSEKRSTMMAAMRTVMHPSRSTVTVEEAPEFLLEDARQIKISAKLSVPDALSAILRHDPDIVMVGELRNAQDALIAFQVANIGHLVLSTLSSRNAVDALQTLNRFIPDASVVVQGLNAIVVQHSLRQLCERCKQPLDDLPVHLPGWLREEITARQGAQLFRPVGCVDCKNGYHGHITLFEAVSLTPELHDLLLFAQPLRTPQLIEAVRGTGMRPFRVGGMEALLQGQTSIDEAAMLPA